MDLQSLGNAASNGVPSHNNSWFLLTDGLKARFPTTCPPDRSGNPTPHTYESKLYRKEGNKVGCFLICSVQNEFICPKGALPDAPEIFANNGWLVRSRITKDFKSAQLQFKAYPSSLSSSRKKC